MDERTAAAQTQQSRTGDSEIHTQRTGESVFQTPKTPAPQKQKHVGTDTADSDRCVYATVATTEQTTDECGSQSTQNGAEKAAG